MDTLEFSTCTVPVKASLQENRTVSAAALYSVLQIYYT